MSDVIYKLYGTVTGTSTDSAATLDIQDDGKIEGVFMDLSAGGMDALSDQATAEVSFASSNTRAKNDSRSSIMTVRLGQNFLTSGGSAQGRSAFAGFAKGITVNAGERVHLHLTGSTGVIVDCYCYLYVAITNQARQARRGR